ncbi:MAG: PadR family transcriptional regulator [Ignisphaera sp.]|uniref:PadR family transcriptional regulator n=1 Tax=Ignisphaera aggregans TaxID=334771 RepID=A0A7J3N0I6_9CREN
METLDDIHKYLEEPFLKGLLRILILGTLKRGELYGYQIYKYVKNIIKSKISLSTFYTILKELEEAKFIIKIGSKYILTEKGLNALRLFLSKYNDLSSFLSI